MAIQWDIRTPNPMVPLQAAALGETMRRNRMQEQRQVMLDRSAAAKAEEEARRYGLEQTRAAMTDYARLVQQVSKLPAEQQDAAFGRGMEILESVHPVRNGVDPWATVTRRLEAGEPESMDALAPFLDAEAVAKPLLRQGVNPQTGALEWFDFSSGQPAPTGLAAPKREPLVVMGGGGAVRSPTSQELQALGIEPGSAEAEGLYFTPEGKLQNAPETAGAQEQREARTRAAKEVEALNPVLSALRRYKNTLDETGAEAFPVGEGATLQATYRDAQLALKEAANLGVLSGPDLELLESVLLPPVGIGAKASEALAGFTGGVPAYRQTLDNQIQALEQRIESANIATATPLRKPEAVGRTSVPGDIPRVRSQADYDAIPMGERYQAPDGTIRQKGGG